jgi:hypothetical protein
MATDYFIPEHPDDMVEKMRLQVKKEKRKENMHHHSHYHHHMTGSDKI